MVPVLRLFTFLATHLGKYSILSNNMGNSIVNKAWIDLTLHNVLHKILNLFLSFWFYIGFVFECLHLFQFIFVIPYIGPLAADYVIVFTLYTTPFTGILVISSAAIGWFYKFKHKYLPLWVILALLGVTHFFDL